MYISIYLRVKVFIFAAIIDIYIILRLRIRFLAFV